MLFLLACSLAVFWVSNRLDPAVQSALGPRRKILRFLLDYSFENRWLRGHRKTANWYSLTWYQILRWFCMSSALEWNGWNWFALICTLDFKSLHCFEMRILYELFLAWYWVHATAVKHSRSQTRMNRGDPQIYSRLRLVNALCLTNEESGHPQSQT